LTIGQVARVAGLPASAIRYYESAGVLPKPARKRGIRDYALHELDEIVALRFYREMQIPIRGLKAIAAQRRGTRERRAVWSDVINARIGDLDAWMRKAKQLRKMLARAAHCRCNGNLDRCEVVRAGRAMATSSFKRGARKP
jgi:DNA-binding transcriptional MerR regulator